MTHITKKNRRADVLARIQSPCTSFWLREQYQAIQNRDCVDAYYDCLALAAIAKQIMDGKI